LTFQHQIQGLRAWSVMAVLAFHIWPGLVPGGYVGVDVFFVISGYLVTDMILRGIPMGGVPDIRAFYWGRSRRLLPAATLVLIATGIGSALVLPSAQLSNAIEQILASALYIENWHLARLAVDYLGAETAPGPAQHFWTLSVEWQFYVFYPILVLFVHGLALRIAWPTRNLLMLTLALITIAALALSVVQTALDPATAYFSTFTRVWELTLGGLTALASPSVSQKHWRSVVRLIGLSAICAACFTFSGETTFPGYAALLPVCGAILVIVSSNSSSFPAIDALLMSPPARYVGDISYSLYLWHWPVLIFYLSVIPGPVSWGHGLVIVAISFALADVTRRRVEQPFRKASRPGQVAPAMRGVLIGAAALPVFLAAGSVFWLALQGAGSDTPDAGSYPGYLALLDNVETPILVDLVPPALSVKQDRFSGYDSGCHLDSTASDPNPCQLGVQNASYHVMLLGDSHATNWIPALEMIAEARGWRLTTHTKASCAPMNAMLMRGNKPYTSCLTWAAKVIDDVRTERPDLVLWSKSSAIRLAPDGSTESHSKRMRQAMRTVWRELASAAKNVVIIADTPRMTSDLTACAYGREKCATPVDQAIQYDASIAAQSTMPSIGLIDMNDALCDHLACPASAGNIVIWRDTHHITRTYARNLAPLLNERLDAALVAVKGAGSND
jgi:peptidoglycan/LPS O-acetylase OafA/YrhL